MQAFSHEASVAARSLPVSVKLSTHAMRALPNVTVTPEIHLGSMCFNWRSARTLPKITSFQAESQHCPGNFQAVWRISESPGIQLLVCPHLCLWGKHGREAGVAIKPQKALPSNNEEMRVATTHLLAAQLLPHRTRSHPTLAPRHVCTLELQLLRFSHRGAWQSRLFRQEFGFGTN